MAGSRSCAARVWGDPRRRPRARADRRRPGPRRTPADRARAAPATRAGARPSPGCAAGAGTPRCAPATGRARRAWSPARARRSRSRRGSSRGRRRRGGRARRRRPARRTPAAARSPLERGERRTDADAWGGRHAAVLREPEHALGDDVPPDLVGAAVDGLGARVEEDALERIERVAVPTTVASAPRRSIIDSPRSRCHCDQNSFESEASGPSVPSRTSRVSMRALLYRLSCRPIQACGVVAGPRIRRPAARPERADEIVELLLERGLIGEHGGPASVPMVPITTDDVPVDRAHDEVGARPCGSVNNTSANSAPSARLRIGRMSTPGWSAGTRINDNPVLRCRPDRCGTGRTTSRRVARSSSRSSGRSAPTRARRRHGRARDQGRTPLRAAEALAAHVLVAHDARQEPGLLLVASAWSKVGPNRSCPCTPTQYGVCARTLLEGHELLFQLPPRPRIRPAT